MTIKRGIAMRTFTLDDLDKYLEYVDREVVPLEEIEGHCHQCGALLDKVPLSDGPESAVACLDCLDAFIADFRELEECGKL